MLDLTPLLIEPNVRKTIDTSWFLGDSLDKVGYLSVGDTVIVNGTIIYWDGFSSLYAYPCSIVD